MKFSPKEILIRKYVKTTIAWRGTFCFACNYEVWFETMYKIVGLGRKKRGCQHFCWDCCRSKEAAFDMIYPQQITAQDIIIQRERDMVRSVLRHLIDDLHSLPDGEVSPSVHNAILRYSLECQGEK